MKERKFSKSNYLITGIAGTGKTTVGECLASKGFSVIEFDGFPSENISLNLDLRKHFDKRTGELSGFVRGSGWDELQHVEWKVDHEGLMTQLDREKAEINFVSGYADNWPEFKNDFNGIFLLTTSPSIIEQRLANRVNGDWGRIHPEELKHALDTAEEFNSSILELGAIAIDTNQSVDDIASQIISHASEAQKL
ncbi:MAG: AAA family ATPase [Candidatus Saccharimonas sp.]